MVSDDEYMDMNDWWSEGEKVKMKIVLADPRTGKIDILVAR